MTNDARRYLSEIPELMAQLPLMLLPGSAPTDDSSRSNSGPGSRPLVVLQVLDLLDEREKRDAEPTRTDYAIDRAAGARRQGVLPTLSSWVRLVDSELWDDSEKHDPPADSPTVLSECGFLLTHLEWIDERQWANELHDEMGDIWRNLRGALAIRDAEVFHCPDCRWVVEPQDGGAWYRCSGCHRTWAMANEINALMRRQANVMTMRECAKAAELDLRTLQRYRADGALTPVAWRQTTPLFNVEHVRSIQAKVAKTRNASDGRYLRGGC